LSTEVKRKQEKKQDNSTMKTESRLKRTYCYPQKWTNCLKLRMMIETVQRWNGWWKQKDGNKNFEEELRCRA